jgi:hypothetical protein
MMGMDPSMFTPEMIVRARIRGDPIAPARVSRVRREKDVDFSRSRTHSLTRILSHTQAQAQQMMANMTPEQMVRVFIFTSYAHPLTHVYRNKCNAWQDRWVAG